MNTHFKMLCYIFAASLALVLAGCAQTAPKPEPTSPSAGGPSTESDASKGLGQKGGTKESATPGGTSSLKDLQEGKTGAAAAGPLKDIYFDYDRSDLRGDARETLRANADWLKKNPAARVEIEGHCDDRGTNEYNLALGAKRAQSAKDYLTTLGITADRLSTISYGEEIPVCKEPNESCWRQNRRARFVIIPSRPAS